MKKLFLMFIIALLTLTSAFGETLISEDFFADPGWVSSNASKLYWDATNQAYYVNHYKPDAAAAYVDLQKTLSGSFTLTYDVKITRADFDTKFLFGLTNNQDFLNYANTSCNNWGTTKYAIGEFSYVADHNGGKLFNLGTTAGYIAAPVNTTAHWTTNAWYQNELSYNASTKILKYTVYSSGVALISHESPNFNLDNEALRYLGIQMVSCNNNSTSIEALVDNVKLVTESTYNSIPMTLSNWDKQFCGNMEETAEGIKIYGSGSRRGNYLVSKNFYNFSGKEIYIKWKANGNGTYMGPGVLISNTASAGGFTTAWSFNGSKVISNDTWYYTRFTINTDKTVNAVTATSNYDNAGGSVFHTENTTVSTERWHLVETGNIMLVLWDNYGSTGSYIVLNEARTNASQVSLAQATVSYNFEDSVIPNTFTPLGNWSIDNSGYNSSKSIYLNGSAGDYLSLTTINATAISFDIKTTAVDYHARFSIDGTEYDRFDGTPNQCWIHYERALPSGTHNIKWEMYGGYNIWLDNIKIHSGQVQAPSNPTITATAGTGGSITPSGSVSVTQGGSQSFTITANSGYQITDVNVDGTSVGTVSTYTFSNVTANHTIAATFSLAAAECTVIPDTGQEKCYNDYSEIACPSEGETFYGQDAQYHSTKQRFQDNGDGTITDLNTGLMWQQSDDGVKRTWDDAKSYCDNLSLAGYSDWRLPNTNELSSISDESKSTPDSTTNSVFSCQSADYWSGTTHIPKTDHAWSVGFYYGNVSHSVKSYQCYVRSVRLPSCKSLNPLIHVIVDNGDGTVTDKDTGLMWQKDDVVGKSWKDAMAYCENLTLAGYSDWRLPNLNELLSISDKSKGYPAMNSLFSCHSPYYWASTTFVYRTDYAWCVGFTDGYDNGIADFKTRSYNLRAVRFATNVSTNPQYTITASAGTGGTISPTGSVSVNQGASQTFTITANSGYEIEDVKVNGTSVGKVSTYTISNVTSNQTIAASFKVKTYTITASAGTGGTISPTGSVSVNQGANQAFTITANSGYEIEDVKVNGTSVGKVSTYTISNV
ncbi:MAG: DUF1566 domain-containing protein, partial [Desulfobacterales bacterium]|nr:DUF1566 domain-containing protein [Desulfobacterales bacterium]